MKEDIAGLVGFFIEVKIHPREMAAWSPERIAAFFAGIAQVERAVAGEPGPTAAKE